MLIAAGGEAQCAAGCVRSQDDCALTQQGRAQVRHLVAQVAHRRVAAVYSSAMRRAAESAELAASALGLPVVVLDGLQELSAGDREPVSCDDRGARHVSHAMVQAGLDIGWPPAQDGPLVVERFGEAIARDRRHPPGRERARVHRRRGDVAGHRKAFGQRGRPPCRSTQPAPLRCRAGGG
jgi:broad specificity phosphatase PhoE